ncbi:MAG: serine/threonine protein kinase [Proteobacteria bacterium]|nr:serine/threonine protein kinase [Pseudomonadota bacterium]
MLGLQTTLHPKDSRGFYPTLFGGTRIAINLVISVDYLVAAMAGASLTDHSNRAVLLKNLGQTADRQMGSRMMVTLEAGTLFAGRYEILRRIGAGGMGAVYLACDPIDRDFKVALKLLHPGTLQSPTARERFRNEITAHYQIKHPNVVRAYEYFDAEDVQAYAMEYVDGCDLLERLRQGRMAPSEVAQILTQVASALEAIHKAGIVHRDLKPENIMLTRGGQVKISDFGVARVRDSRTLTNVGSMVGTPKYLAPEYVETGECDGRGDIFAVGVIAYELISGDSPFGRDFKPRDVLERLRMHIPPLLEVVPRCPPDLAHIIHRAMCLRVLQRYQSATELREDLERFEAGKPLGLSSEPTEKVQSEQQIAADSDGWTSPSRSELSGDSSPSGGFFLAPSHSGSAFHPRSSHATPILIVTFAFSFILGALGFASVVMLRSSNPLKGLATGVYTGSIEGVRAKDGPIPVGLWSFPDHALVLVGKRGCAADLLSLRGEYQCQTDVYRFAVNTISDSGAAGLVGINGAAPRKWSVSRFVAPLPQPQRDGTALAPPTEQDTIRPIISDRPTAPESAAPRTSPAEKSPTNRPDSISTIEAKLLRGELPPEEAARLLLGREPSKPIRGGL